MVDPKELEDIPVEELRKELLGLRARIVELESVSEEFQNPEPKLPKQSFEENHRTYVSLFQMSRDAIVVADLEGRILDANRPFLRFLGYELDELRSMHFDDLTPNQWSEIDRQALEELEKRGHTRLYEKEYRHKDGKHVPIAIQTWKVDSDSPQLFAFVRDLSTDRRTRNALQQSEDRLRIVADGLPARIVYIDRDLRMGFSNRKYREHYGLADEDITGRDLIDVIGEEIYENVRHNVEVALSGHPVSFDRKEVRSATGGVAHLHSSYAPVKDSEGRVEGFYALITDVTEQRRVAEALESSERRFRSLAAGAPAGVFECDAAGGIIYANRYWEEMVGLTVEEILGEGWIRCVHPDDVGRVVEEWREAAASGSPCEVEWRTQRKDGEIRWLVGRSRPIKDDYDRVTGHVGTVMDVTERKLAEQEALEVADRLQTMADSIPVSIVFVDRDQRYQFSNAKHKEWYGSDCGDLLGRAVPEYLGEENYAAAKDSIEAVLRGESVEQRIWQTHADGHKRFLSATFMPQTDAAQGVTGYWVLAQDITKQKRDQDRIQRLAFFDSMTGLPNRQLFRASLGTAVERARQAHQELGLVFLDIDRFKQINDNLGHAAGDAVLKDVARRLETVVENAGLCPSGSPPISRYGGDEFAILMEAPVDADTLTGFAQDVRDRLAEPFDADGRELSLSATVGFSLFPRDANDAESLLNRADAAMLKGKRTGRGSAVPYTAQIDENNRRNLEIEARLRSALPEGAFHLLYQLQQSTGSGEVVGAEALLRWHDSQLGEVSPGEFIPIAEESGLIVDIGEWVFAQVCEQCRAWDEAGFEDVRLGVNLSVRQLREPNLAARFAEICESLDVAPRRIELEITESALIDDVGDVSETLRGLCELGFQLALDDFGTGYSSLTHLRQFPIDRLKIDRSFVMGIPDEKADCELTSAVIAMAHKLRLQVVAEGVEELEQAEYLGRIGCDELQGFLLGRPEPSHVFAQRLRLRKPDPE